MNRFFIRYPQFRRKAFTLSFDDGVTHDVRMIETLNRYGLKCTFNLNGGAFDGSYTAGRPRLGRDAISVYDGHEVALHSFYHPFLEQLPAGNAAWEIVKDREILESVFSRIIRGMAYPMGTLSDDVVATLHQCGVAYARTTKATHNFNIPDNWLRLDPTCHHTDPMLLQLCDDFLALQPKWGSKLFYVWGHSYEFEENHNWDLLDTMCEKMAGKDDIWYATNMEIYDYLSAAGQIQSSVDGTRVYNPTAVTLWLEGDKVRCTLAPGQSLLLSEAGI
ncbi:MAG: polysaccharide deacetylase family protein [Clostridia bacterium]|nr:polysaccharide deacetylase family protein [Clostridia bacterium]